MKSLFFIYLDVAQINSQVFTKILITIDKKMFSSILKKKFLFILYSKKKQKLAEIMSH